MFQKFITATLWYDESTKLIRYGYNDPMDYFTAGILMAVIIIVALYRRKKYRETSYYNITHNSRWKVFWDKGLLGEYQIYKKLRYLEKAGAKFLFNIYLPKEDGTTEIDVLLITPYGIFCIESKNIGGWIFGNENQKKWTQVLPRGRGRSQKTQFMNPIIQNKGHIKELKNILGDDYNIRSVIVFSERCTFKDLTLKSPEIKVIYRDLLVLTMEEMLKYVPDKVITSEQIDLIYEKLYPYTQVSEEVKKEHIKNIQKALQNEEVKEENVEKAAAVIEPVAEKENVCPVCGGKLVKRTARNGKFAGNSFYGCSNYPKCRYIKNIDV